MYLPITLTFAASATLINAWLTWRVGQMRGVHKVSHGDGGAAPLMRRMRAQANYIEWTPLVLILSGLVELANGPGLLLASLAATYAAARIIHALGMDSETQSPLRTVGFIVGSLCALTLAVMAYHAAWTAKSMMDVPVPQTDRV